ncbi:MAG: HNH/ENDO VII family nuclease, partial [Bacteroidota bacterium]
MDQVLCFEVVERLLRHKRGHLRQGGTTTFVAPPVSGVRGGNNVISNTTQQIRKYWTKQTTFKNVTVYQRNDIFDPKRVSTWSVNGKIIEGTNLQRMAAGRAPIGIDGKPINLHHMLQSEKVGGIAEMTQTFHKANHTTIHINPSTIPSGINRDQFETWRISYWKNRA